MTKKNSILILSLFLILIFQPLSFGDQTKTKALEPNAISITWTAQCSYPDGHSFVNDITSLNFRIYYHISSSDAYWGIVEDVGYSIGLTIRISGSVVKTTTVSGTYRPSASSITISGYKTVEIDISSYVGTFAWSVEASFTLTEIRPNPGTQWTGSDTDVSSFTREAAESSPSSYPPIITITSPANDYLSFDLNSVSTVTLSATVTDGNENLDRIRLFWNETLLYTWYSPPTGTKTYVYSLPAATGSVTVRWSAQDDHGNTDNETIHLIIWDSTSISNIELLAPGRFWWATNPEFRANFNDTDGLDEGRMYVDWPTLYSFPASDNITSMTNQVVNLSHNQSLAFNSDTKPMNLSVAYSSVQKYEFDFYYDDTGSYKDADWESALNEDAGTWDWSWNADWGERLNGAGYWDFWEDTNDQRNYFTKLSDASININGEDHFFVEFNLTSIDSFSNFEAVGISIGLDDAPSRYAHVSYCPGAGVIKVGVKDSYWISYNEVGNWLSSTEVAASLNNGSFYQFRIAADFDAGGNEWIAYQVRWANGTLKTYRNSSADATNYLDKLAFYNVVAGIDNADAANSHRVRFDYFATGDLDSASYVASTASAVGLTYTNSTLPGSFGDTIYVNWTATSHCRFNATLTIGIHSRYYEIFTNASTTANTYVWNMPSSTWTGFADGLHNLSIALIDDLANWLWLNISVRKDTVKATGTLILPLNNTEYPWQHRPGLDIDTNWGLNVGQHNKIEVEINGGDSEESGKTFSWYTDESKPSDWPSKHLPIVETPGVHTIRVNWIDYAGNIETKFVYFSIVERQPIYFSLTSSSDGSSIPWIDAKEFEIFLNGFPVFDLQSETPYESFNLTINDQFGSSLYSAETNYAANIQISISVRRVSFSNSIDKMLEVQISRGGRSIERLLAGRASVGVYLADATYKVLADPKDALKSGDQKYIAKTHSCSVASGSTSFSLDCDIEFIQQGGGGSAKYYVSEYGPQTATIFLLVVNILFNLFPIWQDFRKEKVIATSEPSRDLKGVAQKQTIEVGPIVGSGRQLK